MSTPNYLLLNFGMFDLASVKASVEVIVLQPRQNALVDAKGQYLHILEGVAWVTMDGQDYIGMSGDCFTLAPTEDSLPIRISAMGQKPLAYFLK